MYRTLTYFFSFYVGTGQCPNRGKAASFSVDFQGRYCLSYAGDLYSVARTGGTARKITTDIGNELFPRFSPDGKTLAFTGQYDGNTEVYSMPAGVAFRCV